MNAISGRRTRFWIDKQEKEEEERSDPNLVINLPELAFPDRHLGVRGRILEPKILASEMDVGHNELEMPSRR